MKCEVIQDLLPSYVDGLTSDESNELMKEHLSDCKACSEMHNEMKQELPTTAQSIKTPSDYNERKLIKRVKKKIMIVLSTLIVTFTLLGFFIGVFGNVLFQEGNPIPVISSIIKLEFTNAEYVEFATTPNRYISEVKSGPDRHSVVKEYMQDNGWKFKEQMGSGLVFINGDEQRTISTRQYTKNYFIWSIPEKETLLQ